MGTINELIEARGADDGVAILFDERRWTWRETVRRAEQIAQSLVERRRAGPFHVGVLMDNSPNYLFTLFGAALAGATSVGINNTRRGEQLGIDIRHSDCQVLVTDKSNAVLLDGLDLGGAAVEVIGTEGWMDAEPAEPPSIEGISEDSLFTLIFTSGSTGSPKAVQMSHARAYELASRWSSATPADVAYCAIPLFHANALTAMALPALRSGAAIALRERFSASSFMPDIRRYGATFFSTAGRALAYVLDTPPAAADRDHHVKFGLAAEASPRDVMEFEARFGIKCFGGYSSSENAITLARTADMPEDALGVPQGDVDVAIVDATTGLECPRAVLSSSGVPQNPDEAIGEIVGRNVADRFEGYYKNPEATAARVHNGWFWSGDLGYRDADGVFYFAGRTDDWLRVDSENFAAAPVERILARHPLVRGVAVYAVPDERTADDQVMASLELALGAEFDAADFGAFLRAQPDLGTKWAPRYLRLTRLPVGATNKIDKGVLRQQRWSTSDPLFWRPSRELDYVPFRATDLEQLKARFAKSGRFPERR